MKLEKESKGLGDTVAKITHATGLAKIVKAVIPNCGCSGRQKWLNEMVPYKK